MNTSAFRRWSCLVFAGSALMGVGSSEAKAQEQQAAEILEEIVVTARRREEDLMDTPVSITAFTRNDIESRQIEQSHQIVEATPNLVYRNAAANTNIAAIIYIRGIGQSDHIPTVQPGVGTYIDSAYVANTSGALMEMVDIESIEVLRGPQGTLFGRNTIGGAILINTVKPSNEFYGDVEVAAGEYDLRQIKGSVNVPFTDHFFGKFALLYREKDGYIKTPNVLGDDGLPGEETTALRGALRWATDSVTIDWSVDLSNHKSDGVPSVLSEDGARVIGPSPGNPMGTFYWQYDSLIAPLIGSPTVASLDPPQPQDMEVQNNAHVRADADIWNTNLTLQWDITDSITLKSITFYRDQESIDGGDFDLTELPIVAAGNEIYADQFSQELQILGSAFEQRLHYVAGLYYFEEAVEDLQFAPFPIFQLVSGANVENESRAVFGQATYDFNDHWSLTLGGRYTEENLVTISGDNIHYVQRWFCAPGPAPPPVAFACAAQFPPGTTPGYAELPPPPEPGSFKYVPNGEFSSDEGRFEPYINLAYRWNENLLTYASYSEGFKGGGFRQRIPPGGLFTNFKPEFAEVIELGVKSSSQNNRVRLTAAIFRTDYQDLQVSVSSQLGTLLANAADAEIVGGELELAASITDRLQVGIGVGVLDAEYKDARSGAELIEGTGTQLVQLTFSQDNELPNVAESQANAWVAYTLPLASGEFQARLDWRYMDEYYTNARNTTLVPSYDVLNGRLAYIHQTGWELALQGRNLTDEFYAPHVFSPPDFDALYVAPPREIQLRFRYRF